jgi:3-deoxy-D-manno-octulosonate 8-phosphate phosphatase (KDO 8-P phosphatase)
MSTQPRPAPKIKLLVFDVDGVPTDRKLFLVPEDSKQVSPRQSAAQSAQCQIEMNGLHALDCASISLSLARLAGIKAGLITTRISETVALRARDLKLEHVHQGIRNNAPASKKSSSKRSSSRMRAPSSATTTSTFPPCTPKASLTIAVKNDRAEVKQEAHYITPHSGGEGALRDTIESSSRRKARSR